MPDLEMRFVWDHARLSRREDMLVNAILELFMKRPLPRAANRARSVCAA